MAGLTEILLVERLDKEEESKVVEELEPVEFKEVD